MKKTDEERERVLDLFRRWGYLEANLDPLGCLRPVQDCALLDVLSSKGGA
jgi:2-oxoglutarate dehydrogenase complex dehydrogenase (E1) component-like enzyme